MDRAKRNLVIALSFALAVTVFAAFTPKIAHAITATLVQVVNTASNPVPVEVVYNADTVARQSVLLTCSLSWTDYSQTCDLGTSSGRYIVPNGKRLVIDSVSGTLALPQGQFPVTASIGVDIAGAAGPGDINVTPQYLGNSGGYSLYNFAENITAYSDPGSDLNYYVYRPGTGQASGKLTVFGHLEDVPQ